MIEKHMTLFTLQSSRTECEIENEATQRVDVNTAHTKKHNKLN